MARPRKDANIVAVDEVEMAENSYTGEQDPTTLDASDLNYTHVDSPAHKAWLELKGK